jgi:hypothetical protein
MDPLPRSRSIVSYAQAFQRTYEAKDKLGVTGPDGKVRVRAEPRTCLNARAGDRFGIGYVAPDVNAVEIKMVVDRGTVIRAVDAQERPLASLPLASLQVHEGLGGRMTISAQPLGVTDDRGELRCPARTLFDTTSRSQIVAPFAPGAWQSGGVAIDLTDEAPLQVTLRASLGTLRCELLDADGAQYHGHTRFVFNEEGIRRAGTIAAPDFSSPQWLLEVADGSSCECSVAPGQHFKVDCQNSAYWQVAEGEGPQHAWETAVVQAREPAETCSVTGRLRMPDGSPVSHQELLVQYRTNVRPGFPCVWTDATGRFRTGLGTDTANRTLDWLLISLTNPFPDEPVLACLREPGTKLQPGKLDLGDLTLASAPLLVSGHVQTEGIDPAHVRVGVEYLFTSSDASQHWVRFERLLTRAQPPGVFEFYAFGVTAPVRLVLGCQVAVPVTPISFKPGTRDLNAHIARGSSLHGRLEAPGVGGASYGCQLIDESGANEPRSTGTGSSPQFSWSGLPPGSYTLRVSIAGDPEPLAEVHGIHVAAGVDTQDSRLQPLRIATPLHTIRVAVRGMGQPVTRGLVFVDGGGKDGVGYFSLEDSVATVYTRRPSVDLWVCAEGCAPLHAPSLSADLEVDLPRARELQLQVDAPPMPTGFVLLWDFELLQRDERMPREWFGDGRRLTIGADGTCRVPILSELPSRIRCHVQRFNSEYWWPVSSTPEQLPADTNEVRVTVTAADIQAAIQQLPDRDG